MSLLMFSKVKQQFHEAGLMTDIDVDPGCTLNKKIRNAQLAQYNFILGKNKTICNALSPLGSVPFKALSPKGQIQSVFVSLSVCRE